MLAKEGCLSQNLGFLFAIQKHLTKDLNFWLAGVFHQDFLKSKGRSGFSSVFLFDLILLNQCFL
jgi:hypothetical protein